MSSTIIANELSTAYQFDGPRDAPVVMLSNSLLSNYAMWDDQIDALTGAGFRVLRYDTRGHGATDAPQGRYSIALLADDALGLMDALEIEKVHFVGLSMGGFIAQLMGVKYPDRVMSLALCDTACHMPPAELWDERIAMAQSGGTAALADATLGRWFTSPYHVSNPRAVARIRAMIAATDLPGYIGCARAIRDMSQCDLLDRIAAPTIVIVGADDPACPVSSAQTLHEGIAGSEMVIVKDAAHLPNIERRDEFNTALLAFLNPG
jgi:3-oxoadipate enol-lactonase